MQDICPEIHPFFRPGFGQTQPVQALYQALEQELQDEYGRMMHLTIRLRTGQLQLDLDLLRQHFAQLLRKLDDFEKRLAYLQQCTFKIAPLSKLAEDYKTLIASHRQILDAAAQLGLNQQAS